MHVPRHADTCASSRDDVVFLVQCEGDGLPESPDVTSVPTSLSDPAQALERAHPGRYLVPGSCAFQALNGQHRISAITLLGSLAAQTSSDEAEDGPAFSAGDCWWQAYLFKEGEWLRVLMV